MLFLAFFLELTCRKNHVRSPTFGAEATLAFWEMSLFEVLKETVEQYPSQDLPSYAQEGNASVVVARLAVAFPLVDVNDTGILELLWDFMDWKS